YQRPYPPSSFLHSANACARKSTPHSPIRIPGKLFPLYENRYRHPSQEALFCKTDEKKSLCPSRQSNTTARLTQLDLQEQERRLKAEKKQLGSEDKKLADNASSLGLGSTDRKKVGRNGDGEKWLKNLLAISRK